jgi:hypothetical protein
MDMVQNFYTVVIVMMAITIKYDKEQYLLIITYFDLLIFLFGFGDVQVYYVVSRGMFYVVHQL